MSFLHRLIYRFNVMLSNIITDFYVELNKHSKGFIEVGEPGTAKRLFKKKNIEGLTIKL